MRASLVASLLLAGCPARAPLPPAAGAPDTAAEVRYAYYDVTGETAAELRAALDAAGPTTGADTRRFDGVTDWRIAWRFTTHRDGDGCVAGPATASVTATVHLPRWEPATDDADLVARWTTFVDALTRHELGHVAIAELRAADLLARIDALGPLPTCAAATEAANAAGYAVIDDARHDQRRYDQRTHHGRTQGVAFE